MRLPVVAICMMAIAPVAHAEVKTVSWFLMHPDARNRVHQLCMNNPGEAHRVPDCLNAATAIERSAINKIPVQSNAQRCATMPAYQRPFAYCGG